MSSKDQTLIARIAAQHSLSQDAVQTILDALRRSGGAMAQFSHADFGGMAQWSRGMTMVGDMFNTEMKAKLDAVCTELAAHLAETPAEDEPQRDSRDDVSYRAPSQKQSWWPAALGEPSSVGAQNDMRYAVFPSSHRLAIRDGETVHIYDTGSHNISGVAQAQSGEQTLTFRSQEGLVRVNELPKLSE